MSHKAADIDTRLRDLDRLHHLHPFTDLQDHAQSGGRVIARAEHIYVYGADGKRYLDGMSGLWCCNLGYSREEIVRAITRQLQTLPYYNNFFQCANQPAIELAEVLAEVSPAHVNSVFFTNSGSEANDTVIRLVRRYWDALGKPEKRIIISRENAYHGSTIAAASLGGMAYMHEQFKRLPDIEHIRQPYWFEHDRDEPKDEFGRGAARALEEKIDALGEDRVAAFIAEPVQGAGGVIVPPDSYWPEIRRICESRDILLISDEVICGFGRTGRWFGSEYYQVDADLMPFAKGVTGGYQPLGGVLVADRVADVLRSTGGEFGHGFTYSGHPVTCAAALATIEILRREDIVGRVANDIGPYLQRQWQTLSDHPIVGEVRGLGMLGGLELVRDKASRQWLGEPGEAGLACREASLKHGLIMRATGDSMIIAPPLVIRHEEVDQLVTRAGRALDDTAAAFGVSVG